MKLISFILLLYSFHLSANSDLALLEEIVRAQILSQTKIKTVLPHPDSPGSTVISQDASMNEILESVERCRNEKSLVTDVSEGEEFRNISFSCKIDKEIVLTETLVTHENKIESYQEMTFREKLLYPQEYMKLLESYDVELTEISEESSSGLKNLGTFTRLGIPVALSFKASKILAPTRTDWQKHFITGSLIGGVTILTTRGIMKFFAKKRSFHISERKLTYISSIAGLMVSLLGGGGKELYDRTGRGTPEWRDAMFTAAGGAMVSMFYAIPFGRIFGRKVRGPVLIPH